MIISLPIDKGQGTGSEREATLLSIYDKAPTTWRFWTVFSLLLVYGMFDYYDFFVVGYIVTVLAPEWHLTYGQSTTMLIGAGVGAIIGSLLLGNLADIIGRKSVILWGGVLVALSAGGLAFVPQNAWIVFALLRVLVGVGLGGGTSAHTAYIVELSPLRYRTFIGSISVAAASLGIMAAAFSVSKLYADIGWRGLAALGFIPLLLTIFMAFVMVESPRWLVSRGRYVEARRAVARQLGVSAEGLPLPAADVTVARPAPLKALLHNPRAFWLIVLTWFGISATTYGYQLWGPLVLASTLKLPVKEVAEFFTVVAVTGMVGRFVFSILPIYIGRRHAGEIMGWGAAVFIFASGWFHLNMIGGFPAFIICLAIAAIFVNGGFSNMGPYSAEMYPIEVAGRAVGLAQAVNGVGKIAGPFVLGLIAGVGNLVSAKVTESAVVPGFTFLAICSLIAGIAYRVFPIETHNKQQVLHDQAGH